MKFLRKWAPRVLGVGAITAVAFDCTNDHVLRRTARTAVATVRLAYLYKTTEPSTVEELSDLHRRAATIILNTCRSNEGLYIKLGQGLAALNHVLPEEYLEVLTVLLDDAPTVPLPQIRKLFAEETGKDDFSDVFVDFEERPIASASIAQVHRAKIAVPRHLLPRNHPQYAPVSASGNSSSLTSSSSSQLPPVLVDVAVKIQKPVIQKQNWWDLQAYINVNRLLQWSFQIPLMWTAETIMSNFMKEIDFRNEAENSDRAKQMLQVDHPDVYVPHVYQHLTSKRVLVTEWIDAVKLSQKQAVAQSYNVKQLLTTVLEAFGDMIFTHGFVHSDPHPANLLVRPNQNPHNKKPYEVVLLDFGLCAQETDHFRLTYALFFKSVLMNDRESLRQVVTEWGFRDPDLFTAMTIQRPFTSTPVTVGEVTKADIMQMENMMKQRAVTMLKDEARVPRDLVFVGRSMNLLRSLNKMYGAPVNRIQVLAGSAVRGLKDLSTVEEIRERHPRPALINGMEDTSQQQSSVALVVTKSSHRSWLRRQQLELQFHLTLFLISCVHQYFLWRRWLWMLVFGSKTTDESGGTMEDALERQEAAMVRGSKPSHHHHQPMRIGGRD